MTEEEIRAIVRDEVQRIAVREAEAELEREQQIDRDMAWELMQP